MAEQAKSGRPYRIADCFVGRIGNPHRRQFAGSMQFGQHRRVADERRRDHNAGMFETRKGHRPSLASLCTNLAI
jgi:hypothetical protein